MLDGILWILRTGAPWRDLPERYPPYQTCRRRFQRWNEEGVLEEVLRALAKDLKERGGLDLSECFVDATFVGAKKGEDQWERPSGVRARSSWRWQTALVFLSPYARRALAHTRSPSSGTRSTAGSSRRSPNGEDPCGTYVGEQDTAKPLR